jgi:hypothetical protein
MITVSIYPDGEKMLCRLASGNVSAVGEGRSFFRALLSGYFKLILKIFSIKISIWRERWNAR